MQRIEQHWSGSAGISDTLHPAQVALNSWRVVATGATIDPILARFDLTRAGLNRHVSPHAKLIPEKNQE
jgi:hypothetical protein